MICTNCIVSSLKRLCRRGQVESASAHIRHMSKEEASKTTLKVMCYNTRHAKGMDDRVDVARLAARIQASGADLVGLQEIDRGTNRSDGVDQIAELGRLIGFHSAYGAFMDYDGGQYGLGVLSRYPIVESRTVPIPDKKEPRVALFVTVELPSGEKVCLADIHFDCIEDDTERIGQAQIVASSLREIDMPSLLMGDFNDEPGTRTIGFFRSFMLEAVKPDTNRLTFPSAAPDREIDFLFLFPAARWVVNKVEVVDDSMTSDHRPIVAELTLLDR